MIRHDDRRDPVIDRDRRILGGEDALQHDRQAGDRPLSAQVAGAPAAGSTEVDDKPAKFPSTGQST